MSKNPYTPSGRRLLRKRLAAQISPAAPLTFGRFIFFIPAP